MDASPAGFIMPTRWQCATNDLLIFTLSRGQPSTKGSPAWPWYHSTQRISSAYYLLNKHSIPRIQPSDFCTRGCTVQPFLSSSWLLKGSIDFNTGNTYHSEGMDLLIFLSIGMILIDMIFKDHIFRYTPQGYVGKGRYFLSDWYRKHWHYTSNDVAM